MAVGLLSVFIPALLTWSFASADIGSEYNHLAYLDEAKTYKLHWKIDNDKEVISFAVEVNTLGWVGFGISSGNGNMVGGDVVIGWVKGNKGYLKDRYADTLALPTIDVKQDYSLTEAYEQNGKTVLKFFRKYDTCDNKDQRIEDGAVHVIYAYHSDDPLSDVDIPKHQVRGSRSLNLLENLLNKPKLPNDLQYFETRTNMTTVSNKSVTIICKPFKIPNFNGTKKHVVKISPVITPGNEGIIHHMLLYGCQDDFPESNLTFQGPCYSSKTPDSIRGCIPGSIITGWARGGKDFYFPGHVGYPVGDDLSVKYVVMEIHYDNPQRKSGLADKSGFRLFYTSYLRQYDASILLVGWAINTNSNMWIPPKEKKWNSIGYCPSECTKQGLQDSILPEKGIKVFASILHAHSIGSALWTKHVSNGVELPEIARNNHYNFLFQKLQVAPKEIHILPGDDIIHYCQYHSTSRTKISTSRFSRTQEMCLNFMYYYPRVNLTNCVSKNPGIDSFIARHST